MSTKELTPLPLKRTIIKDSDEGDELMGYQVHTILAKEEVLNCPIFEVSHFMWTCQVRPQTFGRMGYLKGQGLYIQMTCLESSPKRVYQNHRENVYQDSAMEVFFAFPDAGLQQSEPPENEDVLYLNFEVNANGAMYAQYGIGRHNRQFITAEEYVLTGVKAVVAADQWTVELLIPNELLQRVGGIAEFS